VYCVGSSRFRLGFIHEQTRSVLASSYNLMVRMHVCLLLSLQVVSGPVLHSTQLVLWAPLLSSSAAPTSPGSIFWHTSWLLCWRAASSRLCLAGAP
jgi:hypothetical protein